MIKKIFIYWDSGFVNAPEVVRGCLESWKNKNSTWEIVELSDSNVNAYVDISAEIPGIDTKQITKTSYSDVLRIFLLEKYGGCWCDATTFCNIPLDEWLYKSVQGDFFAFKYANMSRMLGSFFLYSGKKNNEVVCRWKQRVVAYINKCKHAIGSNQSVCTLERWKNRILHDHYFWFHYLFRDAYLQDAVFRKIWDSVPLVTPIHDIHYFQYWDRMLSTFSQEVKEYVRRKEVPVFKLTYKYNNDLYSPSCNLYYLLHDS